jgi:hypothetical protein
MTRLRRLVFVAAAATVMLMPRAASAQGGLIDFIESLSGPGPFRGGGFVLRLACMTTADTAFRGTAKAPWEVETCLNDEDIRVANNTVRRVRQIVELRGLWASTPEGQRPVLLADPDDTRNVDTFKLDMVAAFRIAPFLDLGAGGGVMRFTVADGVVNGVSREATTVYRPIIVPVSITVTPLAVYRENNALPTGAGKFRRAVRLRLDVNYIPFGFTGSSWGKPEIPTNVYSTDGNWVLSGGLILDAGPFLGNR